MRARRRGASGSSGACGGREWACAGPGGGVLVTTVPEGCKGDGRHHCSRNSTRTVTMSSSPLPAGRQSTSVGVDQYRAAVTGSVRGLAFRPHLRSCSRDDGVAREPSRRHPIAPRGARRARYDAAAPSVPARDAPMSPAECRARSSCVLMGDERRESTSWDRYPV
jgi:hypothetical protein